MSGWAGLAWLLLAAAAAGLREVVPRRPPRERPSNASGAQAADFGHVYEGTVSRDAERLYAFSYTSKPGQVRRGAAGGGFGGPPVGARRAGSVGGGGTTGAPGRARAGP